MGANVPPFIESFEPPADENPNLPSLSCYLAAAHNYIIPLEIHSGKINTRRHLRDQTVLRIPTLVSRDLLIFPGRIMPFVAVNDPVAERFFDAHVERRQGDAHHLALFFRRSQTGPPEAGALLKLLSYFHMEGRLVAKFEVAQILYIDGIILPDYSASDRMLYIPEMDVKTMVESCHYVNQYRSPNYPVPPNGFQKLLLADRLAKRVADYFQTIHMPKELIEQFTYSEDLGSVSFHLAEFALLSTDEMVYAYNIGSPEGRILYILDLIKRYETTACSSCGERYNLMDRARVFSAAGISPLFANPHGYYIRALLVDIAARNNTMDTDSFFMEYNWGYLTCPCSSFRGWGFKSDNIKPMYFSAVVTSTFSIIRTPLDTT